MAWSRVYDGVSALALSLFRRKAIWKMQARLLASRRDQRGIRGSPDRSGLDVWEVGITATCAKDYHSAGGEQLRRRYPLQEVAIKRHQKLLNEKTPSSKEDANALARRFGAAEREIVGWGLCLDTIEEETSMCCRAVQMPLLVLERARKDLFDFLQEDCSCSCKHPTRHRRRGHSARPLQILGWWRRAGRAGSARAQTHFGARRRRRWRCKVKIKVPKIPVKASLDWAAHVSGLKEDPYEVVRLLCVDIGGGLESLHEANITHGDLKPRNILIFKDGPKRWVAKLCDFGRAQEESTPWASGTTEYDYMGTKAWPPPGETAKPMGQEGHKRCDLYVYSLVVWSAFHLRGDPLPDLDGDRDPAVLATDATNKLFGYGRWWYPGQNTQLADGINSVFADTLRAPAERKPKPWSRLEKYHATAPAPAPTPAGRTASRQT
ncbi:hypothetical protein B0T14DRAFT_554249 [Immersiella caudata]|uniref:Protein kinase domain-containing protein n=1 Tax=Immersiella caudata TaxID=314043 RepID=A0AA40C448_9PEZI|nr:hypothetical protein B0T14DRAFT_554249 [Immersiella caudata]